MNENGLVFRVAYNVRVLIALTYLYLKGICLSYLKSNELLAARFRVVNEMSDCFALLIFLQFDIWCFIAFVTAGRAHFDDSLFVLFGLHGFLDYHWISQFFVSFLFLVDKQCRFDSSSILTQIIPVLLWNDKKVT